MSLITPDFGIIFWQTVTFLVVLVVLAKFAWKPILQIVQARESAIARAVDQITQAQTLIKQVDDDRSRLIEEANLERERIIGQALVTQQAIIDQAHQKALTVKEQLLTQARATIAKEEARAVEAVKAHVASLVVLATEKLLARELHQQASQCELIERLMANDQLST